MARTLSGRHSVWQVANLFCIALITVFTSSAFAANCVSPGAKCGLPIVSFQSAGSDVFSAMRAASPTLYPSAAAYHVFYDSRTNRVQFQDANGISVKPDASARNFVVVWHDGSGTDWRYFDAELAARVPAAAKADQLAHIVWAIKSATLTPRVILAGSSQDLAYAKYYVVGKAAPQFGSGAYGYNNDLHGMLATDAKVEAEDAAALNAAGISTLLAQAAADQYFTKSTLASSAIVSIGEGIDGVPTSLGKGQSVKLTSKIGPVIWSVLEGPSVGKIDKNGFFTAATNKGSAHIVAVSRQNHSLIAVASFSVAPPPSAPVLTTTAVTGITVAGGTFHGTVNPNGASGTAGFEYSTSATFSPAADTVTVAVSGSTATPLTVTQTRMSKATKYYVRSYFLNGSTHVVTFGNTVTFTVGNSFISATNASNGTSSGATLNAIYNAGGLAGYIYFAYSSNNFASTSYSPHFAVAGDSTTHTISYTLTNLKTATGYKYKAYFVQTNNGGPSQVTSTLAFSTQGMFIESSIPNWAVSITQHGATFPGKFGTGAGPAHVWLEISQSPTFAGGASVYGAFDVPSGTYTYQSINVKVSTLARGTTYYFRYAIRNTANGYIYRYPYTRSFTTLP